MDSKPYLIVTSAFDSWSYKLTRLQISVIQTRQFSIQFTLFNHMQCAYMYLVILTTCVQCVNRGNCLVESKISVDILGTKMQVSANWLLLQKTCLQFGPDESCPHRLTQRPSCSDADLPDNNSPAHWKCSLEMPECAVICTWPCFIHL